MYTTSAANALKVIGLIIIVAGFIIGIVLWITFGSFWYFLATAIGGIISGTLFLGLSELIEFSANQVMYQKQIDLNLKVLKDSLHKIEKNSDVSTEEIKKVNEMLKQNQEK